MASPRPGPPSLRPLLDAPGGPGPTASPPSPPAEGEARGEAGVSRSAARSCPLLPRDPGPSWRRPAPGSAVSQPPLEGAGPGSARAPAGGRSPRLLLPRPGLTPPPVQQWTLPQDTGQGGYFEQQTETPLRPPAVPPFACPSPLLLCLSASPHALGSLRPLPRARPAGDTGRAFADGSVRQGPEEAGPTCVPAWEVGRARGDKRGAPRHARGRAVPLLRTEGTWDPVGPWLGPQAGSSVSQ